MKNTVFYSGIIIIVAASVLNFFLDDNPNRKGDVEKVIRHESIIAKHQPKNLEIKAKKANIFVQNKNILEQDDLDFNERKKTMQDEMDIALADQQRRVANLSDEDLIHEITQLKNELVQNKWIEKINNKLATTTEQQQFQLLLRQHDALHLEKAERALEKIQNLLSQE